MVDEEDEAKDLYMKARKRAEDEINKLKEENNFENPTVFQIAKNIRGAKKIAIEAVAIKDPKKKTLVVAGKEIKKVTLEYVTINLTNNKFEEGFEKEQDILERLQKERMKDNVDETVEIDSRDFDKVVKKFESSRKHNYDFLVKSGTSFKSAM